MSDARLNRQAIWSRRERTASLLTFVGCSLLVAIFLLRGEGSGRFDEANTVGHAGAALALTLSATGVIVVFRRSVPNLRTMLLIGAAITLALELSQGLVPVRTVQLKDIGAGVTGVLIGALCLDWVLARLSLYSGLRSLTVAAGMGFVMLSALLITEPDDAIEAALADGGTNCPMTIVAADAPISIVIGAQPAVVDGCLLGDFGGFGLAGPSPRGTGLADGPVLISSELPDLAAHLRNSATLTIRTEFRTNSFDAQNAAPGMIFVLQSEDSSVLLRLGTRGNRLETLAANGPGPVRFTDVFLPLLSADSTHTAAVRVQQRELQVELDGELVGFAVLDESWGSDVSDDLRLFVAGDEFGRSFDGTINWIEIEVPE